MGGLRERLGRGWDGEAGALEWACPRMRVKKEGVILPSLWVVLTPPAGLSFPRAQSNVFLLVPMERSLSNLILNKPHQLWALHMRLWKCQPLHSGSGLRMRGTPQGPGPSGRWSHQGGGSPSCPLKSFSGSIVACSWLVFILYPLCRREARLNKNDLGYIFLAQWLGTNWKKQHVFLVCGCFA